MTPLDILRLAINSLTSQRVRSWLTIIGIVIGVVSVVTLLALSAGFQSRVGGQLGGLGANGITVTPGFNKAAGGGFGPGRGEASSTSVNNLTATDARIIAQTPGVQYVAGIIDARATVLYRGAKASVTVQGVDPALWSKMNSNQLAAGRYLAPGDTNVAVLGARVAASVFTTPLTLNQVLDINGKQVRVVGILQSAGSFGGADGDVLMPRDTAAAILSRSTTEYSSIAATSANGYDAVQVTQNITARLLLSRHLTVANQDFTVSASAAFQSQIASISQGITLFLGGIAAVALIVGAVGIANTMYSSVMERTKQIGILKALGTTNREIRSLFLIESGLMGFMGGIIGILLGIGLTFVLSNSGLSSIGPGGGGGLSLVVSPQILEYALLFATVIGSIAGVAPAIVAARLQPVESLRSE